MTVENSPYAYSAPGTVQPPGPIGRVARLLLGVACAVPVYSILTQPEGFLAGRALTTWTLWATSVLGWMVFPDVVNLGFTRRWKRSSLRIGLLAGGAVAALAGWMIEGSVVSWPLGTFSTVWLFYTFGHLGLSFLLAFILGTPGCEMRSIPQLLARLTGRTSLEHYCPGFLTPLDRWEARHRKA